MGRWAQAVRRGGARASEQPWNADPVFDFAADTATLSWNAPGRADYQQAEMWSSYGGDHVFRGWEGPNVPDLNTLVQPHVAEVGENMWGRVRFFREGRWTAWQESNTWP